MWSALADPESQGRWLAVPAGAEIAVRTSEAERLLELDWRLPGEERSRVRFELSEEDGATLLVLEHTQIDEPIGMAYIGRWEHALGRFADEVGA